ncbi:NAD(P)-binding protein [Parathielavia appendiculata]|uniref:NAD(P)-binding protein n=1 Tax=Parathielavia appendiculata TaxID=2587402 RepID=A0AAN6Z7E6_9PEZI|nr:NAD(P)-binding protein [Parathielavia appendiculata]
MFKPTVLVTGSAGHLGKALMLALPELGYNPIGIDIKASQTTTSVGSITDTAFLASIFDAHKPDHVIHAATLHKPHVGSHSKTDFVQTNIAGTLALLEAAAPPSSSTSSTLAGRTVKSFVFISTTSAFGAALSSPPGQPAVWIHESVEPVPKNIYGVTKTAAEDVCRLVNKQTGLPVIVLRTSRFFPEEDDDEERRGEVTDGENLKVLELAYRRVDIADVVSACVCAMRRGAEGAVKWGKYIISAPTPFKKDAATLERLGTGNADEVFSELVPGIDTLFREKGWRFLRRIDRVYDSQLAMRREELRWNPEYTFERAIERLERGEEWRSELSFKVGKLGYHDVPTGVYTTEKKAQDGQ